MCGLAYLSAIANTFAQQDPQEDHKRLSDQMIQILSAEDLAWENNAKAFKEKNMMFYESNLKNIIKSRRETGIHPESGHRMYLGFDDLVLKRAVILGVQGEPRLGGLGSDLWTLISIDREGKTIGRCGEEILELLLERDDFHSHGALNRVTFEFTENQRSRIYRNAASHLKENDPKREECIDFLKMAHRKEETHSNKELIASALFTVGVNAEKETADHMAEQEEKYREINEINRQIHAAKTNEERADLLEKLKAAQIRMHEHEILKFRKLQQEQQEKAQQSR